MQNLSPQTNAMLQSLRRAKPMELDGVLHELLNQDEGISEAAEILEGRVEAGDYVPTEDLARILVKVQRDSLYDHVKEKLLHDQQALLILYRGKYPDKDIEKELTNLLYEKADDDGDPYRRMIAEAIRDSGSTETLPVLQAILYDLAPTKGTKNALANALFCVSGPSLDTLLAGAVASSRRNFIDIIVQAIEAVRERSEAQEGMPAENTVRRINVDQELVSNAHRELRRADEKVRDDPTDALICLRRGAEAIGKHLYRHLGHEERGKPAKKMMLDELLKPIKDSEVPDIVKICIQALQPFGNYAAHDQEDEFSNVTPEVGNALIVLFREALTSYENWLREMPGESQ